MSGAVEGVALPDSELIYQALRFFFWSAGQGVSPINTDDAPEPEETFWQYGLRTGDEEWETVAERYRATLTTPPARSYADEDRVTIARALAERFIERGNARVTGSVHASWEAMPWSYRRDFLADADAVINVLSQGGKA